MDGEDLRLAIYRVFAATGGATTGTEVRRPMPWRGAGRTGTGSMIGAA